MRKAIVTLLIGESFQNWWKAMVEITWREYADRHGYDIVIIDEFIDTSDLSQERSPHWQKCLILEHPSLRDYDRVVWIDADIAINFHIAPDILSECNDEKLIGAVSHNQQYRQYPSSILRADKRFSEYARTQDTFNIAGDGDPIERYKSAGLPSDIEDIINTGVMVLSPKYHQNLLRHVYDAHQENDYSLYENLPLSYEILKSSSYQFIDAAYNVIHTYELMQNYPFIVMGQATIGNRMLAVNTIWANSYFLHFVSSFFRDDARFIAKDRGDLSCVSAAMEWIKSNPEQAASVPRPN